MSLRERKKERTRRALGDAAVDLFLDRGFDATTIEDIVAAAGVSRRTFFRYFPTKEAAFFASHDDRFEQFEETVRARKDEVGAWVACRSAFLEAATRYESDRQGTLAWQEVLMANPALQSYDLQLDQQWEGRIRDFLVEDGQAPFEAAVRAGVMMGVVRAVLRRWYVDRGDLPQMGQEAFALIEGGVGSTSPA